MSGAKVGADVESICGKCGDVWHVVVAKVGEKIAQVQCKQCGAVHRYRPPEKVKQAAKSARSSVPAPPRAPKAPKASSRKEDAPLVAFDPSRVGKRYRPVDVFAVGDVLEHPTFGRGVVELATEPGKIQVWFEGRELQPSERRTLVHARLAASATAPAPLPARRPAQGAGQGGDEE